MIQVKYPSLKYDWAYVLRIRDLSLHSVLCENIKEVRMIKSSLYLYPTLADSSSSLLNMLEEIEVSELLEEQLAGSPPAS